MLNSAVGDMLGGLEQLSVENAVWCPGSSCSACLLVVLTDAQFRFRGKTSVTSNQLQYLLSCGCSLRNTRTLLMTALHCILDKLLTASSADLLSQKIAHFGMTAWFWIQEIASAIQNQLSNQIAGRGGEHSVHLMNCRTAHKRTSTLRPSHLTWAVSPPVSSFRLQSK